VSAHLAKLDVETWSLAGCVWDDARGAWTGPPGAPKGKKGLPVVGAFVYWEHPSAEVLTLSYKLPGWNAPKRWRPGDPHPQDLFDFLAAGGEIEFHNAMFEKLAWFHRLTPLYGFPPLDPERVHCSLATAHVNGYPGALGELGPALGTTVQKDSEGKALMDVFSKPRKPTKGDPRKRILPDDSTPVRYQGALVDPRILFERYQAYCDTDVMTEDDAGCRMEPMTADEREAWLLDQRMNWRGVAIDREAVRNCIVVLEQALARYNQECLALTGGVSPQQVVALVGWIKGRGVVGIDSFDSKKSPVEEHLKRTDLPPDVRRVLEIRALVGSAAVKKLYAMENRTSFDDRLRGLFIHHGTRTGRPTGEGVQTTNIVKVGPKLAWSSCCERPVLPNVERCPWCGSAHPADGKKGRWGVEMVDHVLEIMALQSLDIVEAFFGDALLCMQGCMRPMLVAGPGHQLISSDFSAIEAVVAACISGEQWRIDTFKRKEDIYLASASKITMTPMVVYLEHKAATGDDHPDRQKVGKVAELALGFGGWTGSWRNFDPDADSKSDAEIAGIITAWRDASPKIVEMWGGQHRRDPVTGWWRDELFGIEGAFIRAVQNPGHEFFAGPLGFRMTAPFGKYDRLKMRLPSGRELTYHQPLLSPSHKRPGTLSISYMTDNSNPKYGALGWVRMETWGSRTFENAVQAIAHCYMRFARKNLFASGYPLVQEVYDEAVAEVPVGVGSVEDFERIMALSPPWAKLPNGEAWPIRASGGWLGKRYRKS
jgi:DNA polymerase